MKFIDNQRKNIHMYRNCKRNDYNNVCKKCKKEY